MVLLIPISWFEDLKTKLYHIGTISFQGAQKMVCPIDLQPCMNKQLLLELVILGKDIWKE